MNPLCSTLILTHLSYLTLWNTLYLNKQPTRDYQKALQRIGTNPVSCSGVTMGTRNAMLAYTYLLTQQLDPMVRYPQGMELFPSILSLRSLTLTLTS